MLAQPSLNGGLCSPLTQLAAANAGAAVATSAAAANAKRANFPVTIEHLPVSHRAS